MRAFTPVDPFSLTSLFVEPLAHGQPLSSATAFVVVYDSKAWLITNYHVVTGRNTETGEPLSRTGATPEYLRIWHHASLSATGQGAWCLVDEPLYSSATGEPLWHKHPRFCSKDMENPTEPNVDLAALPLSQRHDSIQLHPLDLDLASTDARVSPGLPVSIIGYPFGRTGAALFPIWKTGHIASDPDAYWSPRYFLIDATTRPGMSGAPVIYRAFGTLQSVNGAIVAGNASKFLGVYSGRIRDDAEIGIVWRPELIIETIMGASIAAG